MPGQPKLDPFGHPAETQDEAQSEPVQAEEPAKRALPPGAVWFRGAIESGARIPFARRD